MRAGTLDSAASPGVASCSSRLADNVIVSIAALCVSAAITTTGLIVTCVTYFRTTKRTKDAAKASFLRDYNAEWYRREQPAIAYLQRITKRTLPVLCGQQRSATSWETGTPASGGCGTRL